MVEQYDPGFENKMQAGLGYEFYILDDGMSTNYRFWVLPIMQTRGTKEGKVPQYTLGIRLVSKKALIDGFLKEGIMTKDRSFFCFRFS
jgi:hypothetical protein